MISFTKDTLLDILAGALVLPGAAPLPATIEVHLFVNDIQPTPDSVVGDFTECTATGYASVVPGFGTAFINGNGFAQVLGDLLNFVFTDGNTNPFTLYGYYVTDSAGTTLLFAERLDSPVSVNQASQHWFMVPQITFAQ